MHRPQLPGAFTGNRKQVLPNFERWHPYRMVLWLLICSISMLFLVLLIAFVSSHLYQVRESPVKLPISFLISTILIAFSSYTLKRGQLAYKKEKYQHLTYWFCLSGVLSLSFLITQIAGWTDLQLLGIYLSSNSSGSYLYVLSGLHILHLLGGIVFLSLMIRKAYEASVDGVQALLFSTDPFRKLQLKLLNTYWHFMGGLWLIMYLTFVIVL